MLLLEALERQVLADRQVAAVWIAAGSETPLPTLHEQRRVFDAALMAEPKPATTAAVDDEQMELRRVLGVA